MFGKSEEKEEYYQLKLISGDGKVAREWEILDDYEFDSDGIFATTRDGKTIRIQFAPCSDLTIVVEQL